MADVKIFLSHNSKYSDIARSLMRSLQALDKQHSLDIKISEEMEGSAKWRGWIEDNIHSADLFLLIYPSADMEMSWCNYELGRFDDGKRKVVCIKNTDIDAPPPAFEPYQAYTADAAGIRKFIDELFVAGTFSNGKVIDASIKDPTDALYALAETISGHLAQDFTKARVRVQRYERRIELSLNYDQSRFLAETSIVRGNPDGLTLLGFAPGAAVPWSAVRGSIQPTVDWPSELEGVLPKLTEGALPPALPPFSASGDIYIPVITRAQSVDGHLENLALIFVAVNSDRMRRFLDWSLPSNMPETLAMLIKLLRMMFRSRWEILEPRYQEAKFHGPTSERCAEIVREINAGYEQMRHDMASQGITGLGQFYSYFADDMQADVQACSDEFTELMKKLTSEPVKNSDDLSVGLKNLLSNNAKWLEIGAKQFAIGAARLKFSV